MHILLLSAIIGLLNQSAVTVKPGIHELTFQAPQVGTILYGLSIPDGYDVRKPHPLVVALHPGGTRMRYYGAAFIRQIVAPGLRDLHPIIIAPDCPTASWSDPAADRAVMALLQSTFETYQVDRQRVLVMGFSLGGRGTWFMASHHSDVFTAAIPMAASSGDEPADRLATMPTYVIHSRDDQVVPFAPAERLARQLEKSGRPIRFEALQHVGHFEMGGYVDALRRAGRWIADRWAK